MYVCIYIYIYVHICVCTYELLQYVDIPICMLKREAKRFLPAEGPDKSMGFQGYCLKDYAKGAQFEEAETQIS